MQPELRDTAELNEVHESIWTMLIAGQDDPASDIHWPMLASVGEGSDGGTPEPNVRTVVLRAANRQHRWLECHSAMNTSKINEFRRCPTAMMAFYDKQSRQQIRAKGKVSVHNLTPYTARIWSKLSSRQHAEYGNVDNFGVLRLQLDSLDWLLLSSSQHQRARFDYKTSGLTARMIKP